MDQELAPLRDLLSQREISVDFYATVRREVFSAGYETEAIESALEAFSGDPVRQATLQALLGRLDAALATAGSSSEPAALYLRGRLLLEEGKTKAARDLIEPAYAKHSSPELGHLLVEALALTSDVEEAEKLLDKMSIDQNQAIAHYLRGLVLEKSGEYSDAVASYRRAIELDADESLYHFRLGYLLSLHGDEADAIRAYEQCKSAKPVFTRAMINLGILYEDAERYDEAIHAYRSVLGTYPDHPRASMYIIDAEASCDMYYDREKEKERSRRNQLLQIPITDFELSVRSRNCLQKMNIHTLGDLIKKTEAELLSYKNFGETSLNEIKRILAQKGFRLGQGLDDERQRHKKLPDSEHEKLLSEPVSVLELSSRSQRCMDRLGIETLADLTKRTELELVSQKNFGVTSLNEVKRKLKERNLSLASG